MTRLLAVAITLTASATCVAAAAVSKLIEAAGRAVDWSGHLTE